MKSCLFLEMNGIVLLIFFPLKILGNRGVHAKITVLSLMKLSVFLSVKHLHPWTDFTPTNNESTEKKNLSVFPTPDAISISLFNVPTLRSRTSSILKFVTAIFEIKSVAVIRKQSLLLQGCFLHIILYAQKQKNLQFRFI